MAILLIFFAIFLFSISEAYEVKDRYYPRYHLAPPYGWMNDPNGFCIFNEEYHLFYQFNPNSSLEPGIAHWGHAKSIDLFHWEHLPIALYPDKDYDITGVFSGSALIENKTMYLYYTGNVNIPETNRLEQTQALAMSTDGITIEKYEHNPIIYGENFQPNLRDPKVWKHRDRYFMVLGNSFENNTLGRVILYTSTDKYNWKVASVLGTSDGRLGYMWECPDFFEIDGKFVLLFSPQGVEPKGDQFQNLYQTGYIVGHFDYKTFVFEPITEFVELDRGHDFYATQTLLDSKGRRIVVAWMDMWDQNYPEGYDGFTGMMSIPRELRLTKDNVLIQKPVQEAINIRKKMMYRGSNRRHGRIRLPNKAGEVIIESLSCVYLEVIISSSNGLNSVTIRYNPHEGVVSLDRGFDNLRRAAWEPQGAVFTWRLFIDASSIELFCGDGELSFSSRIFLDGEVFVQISESVRKLTVHSLERSITV